MRIESLELQGYKRLALNHIHYLKITPVQLIQLILGSNGSGKSSLLKELSPLPANPAEYHKDGYKIITIIHNNLRYELKSIFSSTNGNKYWIIKDEEILLDGGTQSVYKEFVKKEFGITPEIHELMIGTLNFHSMSVAERRNWFTKLSDVDYTYAINYYQRLKEQHRDIQGAIKLNQSRLVQESEKLLKPEEEAQYRKEIEEYQKILRSLIETKTSINKTRWELEQNIQNDDQVLIKEAQNLINYRARFLNTEGYLSDEHITQDIITVRGSIQACELRINDICKIIDQQQKTLDALHHSNLASISDIDRSVTSISEELDTLYRQIYLDLKFENPKEAYNALLSIYENLVEVAHNLKDNNDRQYSRDNYILGLERQKVLQNELANQEGLLLKLITQRKEMEHAKEHNETACPRCKYVWYKGFHEKDYENLQHTITQQTKAIEQTKVQLQQLDEKNNTIREYLEQYRVYINISRSWEILNPLWDYLINSNLIFESPKKIPTFLDTLKTDLQVWIKIEETNHRLKETNQLRELITKNKETDVSKIQLASDESNKLLYTLNNELNNLRTRLNTLQSYLTTSKKIKECENEIQQRLHSREKSYQDILNVLQRDAINEAIEHVQLELTRREQLISKIDLQKNIVINLQSQLSELSDKAEVLKIAIKELSPSEGLIAKGLTGFINHFVNQINGFIKKIWLYPLELIPIMPDQEDDSIDLDYKFALRVNDGDPIPDIKLGSSAMKEIINLAFRIISLRCLGLQQVPLFLDELGASFDKAHRTNIYSVIHNLISMNHFSQIFIISHYEEIYGSFKNTDITVLCPANIPLPNNVAVNQLTVIR